MTETLVGYEVDVRGPEGDATALDAEGRRVRLVRVRQGDSASEDAVTAWLGAQGEHVQRVLDVGTAPNGDLIVVLPELPHALADLVAAHPLSVGEAVTVLVPVAEALAALHDAGVLHGAIGVPAIALTDAGAPVLLLPRTARRRGVDEEAVRDDRRALAALARRLLPPPTPVTVLESIQREPAGAGVDALFALADPEPVRVDRSDAPTVGAVTPARLVAPAPPVVDAGRPSLGPTRVRQVAAAARRAVRTVRPRVWLAAGASLVALSAAVVLLPGSAPAARARAEPSALGPSTPQVPPSTRPAEPSAPPDDPVRAAEQLLAARARCLTLGSQRCLDAVDASGSPVDGLDRAAIAAGVDAVLPPQGHPVLLRRTGATAVLAAGPCTVLELRGADGWRLRDVLAPAPAGTQMPSEPANSPSSSRARTAERNRAASAPSTIRWS